MWAVVVITSNTRDLRFESSHHGILFSISCIKSVLKEIDNEKIGRYWPIIKNNVKLNVKVLTLTENYFYSVFWRSCFTQTHEVIILTIFTFS